MKPEFLLDFVENFNQERELLLKEIANLKKQKNAVEEDLINKSVELARSKDNLEKHHLESTHSSAYFSKIEYQVSVRLPVHGSRA